MHDLQPVAKGREGGKMNGLGDGTRSDYAYSKRLAHRALPVVNTLVSGKSDFPNAKGYKI